MIITRAPFRISLGGGGTDLPFYAEKKGGSLITAAINRYIYVSVHSRLLDKLIWLSYSEQETQSDVNAVKHHLKREALKLAGVDSGIEIHSMTELSGRAGLGGSSAFLTALLQALYAYKGIQVSKTKLAQDATHIERVILQDSGGIQDQYIAAHGGFCAIENNSLTDVKVDNLNLDLAVVEQLSKNLLLFYTGVNRSSSDIVNSQKEENKQDEIIAFYDEIKKIGLNAKQCLLTGNLDTFGKTFHDHWMLKREFTKKMSNDNFDRIYDYALRNGSLGGKIVGAGGGGFFLFYVVDDHAKFCEQMKEQNLIPVDFHFDFEGTKIVVNNEFGKPDY